MENHIAYMCLLDHTMHLAMHKNREKQHFNNKYRDVRSRSGNILFLGE